MYNSFAVFFQNVMLYKVYHVILLIMILAFVTQTNFTIHDKHNNTTFSFELLVVVTI